MKRTILTWSVTAVLMAMNLVSCRKIDSNDLKEDLPYYQSYEVTYYKADNITTARAGFKLRNATGINVALSDDAGVRMNNTLPFNNDLDKTIYRWSSSGLNDVTFVLTKNSGKTIKNAISKNDAKLIGFSDLPAMVSKSSGFSFTCSGDTGININESLAVSVFSPSLKDSIITKDVAGGIVSISKEELKNYPAGKLFVELVGVRTVPVKTQDSTAGGSVTSYFYDRREITLNN